MPIYEYRCGKCGHQFEELQSVTDEPLHICPKCGKNTLSKLVSQASFRLKGSGWYETDFKQKTSEKKRVEKSSKKETKVAEKKGRDTVDKK